MRCLTAASVVGLSLSFATIADAAPLELQPTSEWSVTRQGDRCHIVREFGEGRDAVTLMLDKFSQSDNFLLSMAGRPLILPSEVPLRASAPDYGNLPYRIRFRPGDEGRRYKLAFGGKDREGVPYLVLGQANVRPHGAGDDQAEHGSRLSAARGTSADERSARQLLLDQPLERDVILHTGPMIVPLITARSCVDALVRSWGLDPREQESLVSIPTPIGQPANWIKPYDFPRKPLYRGESAMVAVRLLIDTTGKPTACAIQLSSLPEEFGRTSCQTLVERGRFNPARNAEGQAKASYYVTTVLWMNTLDPATSHRPDAAADDLTELFVA